MIYAGIDEAGYGPLLGPLCVGVSAFRLPDVRDAASAPDLWSLLSAGVCRKPKDARRRIAIADSKKLKSAGRQPTVHLERGVLAFTSHALGSDAALFEELGVHARASKAAPWHALELPLPECHTADELAIARNVVRRAHERAGIELARFGVTALDAPAFNALYRELGGYPYDRDPGRPGWFAHVPNHDWADPAAAIVPSLDAQARPRGETSK